MLAFCNFEIQIPQGPIFCGVSHLGFQNDMKTKEKTFEEDYTRNSPSKFDLKIGQKIKVYLTTKTKPVMTIISSYVSKIKCKRS
jgi:hypothetical protein